MRSSTLKKSIKKQAKFSDRRKVALAKAISHAADVHNFDDISFTKAEIAPHYSRKYHRWLSQNYQGDMQYMEKSQSRKDLKKILPGAKTVITLATNYYREQEPLKLENGRVARYAYGRDYHKIIKKNLKNLCQFIEAEATKYGLTAQTKAHVDTGPVLERALAEQSGLGQIGKNSCLITKKYGSWVFLSEIFTTLELPTTNKSPQQPFAICGDCTMCIDACPTGAIVAPGVIDARKCISYLTIENKGNIPEEYAKIIRRTRTLYGCDICQRVCPKNAKNTPTKHPEMQKPIAGDQIPLQEITQLKDRDAFIKKFAGSPCVRAKLKGFKRNAKALER